MNNTKWEELRIAMYELGFLSPRWRTKIVETGYLSHWDGEWFYHFRDGGYEDIHWVEIRIDSPEQDEAVLAILRRIHVPGHRTELGFQVYGYQDSGTLLEYIA